MTSPTTAAPPGTSLVLGAGGFLGGHLCEMLVAAGGPVRGFDRSGFDPLAFPHLAGVAWHSGDFGRAGDLDAALDGCDVVYHLAATTVPATSNADVVADLESNVSATLRMLEGARTAGVRRVVFVSSGGTVYGIPRQLPIREDAPTDPICAYGVHKLAIEKYLHLWRHLHGLDSVVLRTANPYGERQRHDSGQGAIPAFIARALRGQPLQVWGDGSVVRDYLHVDDVARALVLAGRSARAGGVYNIGSGVGHSLNEIVAGLERALGQRIPVEHLDGRAFDVPASVLDVSLAARELGWRPAVPLDEGLRRTVRWMRTLPELAAPGGQKMLSPT